jgi:hypothetical protein
MKWMGVCTATMLRTSSFCVSKLAVREGVNHYMCCGRTTNRTSTNSIAPAEATGSAIFVMQVFHIICIESDKTAMVIKLGVRCRYS